MKFTKTQYKKLEGLVPIAREPAKISNYKFVCVCNLYIIENGCKCISLSKKYGKGCAIYMKFSRWSKNSKIAKAIAFFIQSLGFRNYEKAKTA